MIDNFNEIYNNLETLIDCKNTKVNDCDSDRCKYFKFKIFNKLSCIPAELQFKFNNNKKYLYTIELSKHNIIVFYNKNKTNFNIEEIRKLKNLKSL